jgi:hypothetical protein
MFVTNGSRRALRSISGRPDTSQAANMQEIEGVINEVYAALAVGRSLSAGEARQSGFVDAAQLTVDVSGLHLHIRERRDGARIFGRPIEAGPG